MVARSLSHSALVAQGDAVAEEARTKRVADVAWLVRAGFVGTAGRDAVAGPQVQPVDDVIRLEQVSRRTRRTSCRRRARASGSCRRAARKVTCSMKRLTTLVVQRPVLIDAVPQRLEAWAAGSEDLIGARSAPKTLGVQRVQIVLAQRRPAEPPRVLQALVGLPVEVARRALASSASRNARPVSVRSTKTSVFSPAAIAARHAATVLATFGCAPSRSRPHAPQRAQRRWRTSRASGSRRRTAPPRTSKRSSAPTR